MDYKIREEDGEYLIELETEEKAAVIIQSESGERIYLPGEKNSNSTYYIDDTEYLESSDKGWIIKHSEEPTKVEAIT